MNRKAFIDKLAAQLKVWDSEIEKLEAKAEKAKADAKADYQKEIKNLRDKKQAAQDKLEAVRQSGESAWEELKSGAEDAFDTMKNALQTAMSKFQ
jgi:chromosome segregation ATPase